MYRNEFISIPTSALEKRFSGLTIDHDVRLQRMEAVNADGSVNPGQIMALCRSLFANLYHDLIAAREDLPDHCKNFTTLQSHGEGTGMYLYLCFLYSLVGAVIPQEIQWMVAHNAVLFEFCEAFHFLFNEFLTEDGYNDYGDDDDTEYDSTFPLPCCLCWED